LVLIAWLATRGKRSDLVPAVGRSIKITCLAFVGTWLWGVLHGGSSYQAVFQLRPFILALLMASIVARVYKTRADIRSLGSTVAFASIYRALTAVGLLLCLTACLLHELEPRFALSMWQLLLLSLYLFLGKTADILAPSGRRPL